MQQQTVAHGPAENEQSTFNLCAQHEFENISRVLQFSERVGCESSRSTTQRSGRALQWHGLWLFGLPPLPRCLRAAGGHWQGHRPKPKDSRRQVSLLFPANAEILFFLAFCVGLRELSEDLLSPTGLVSSVRVSGLAFRNDPQGRFGDVYSAVERASRATKLQNVGFALVYLCKQAKGSRVCENYCLSCLELAV